MPAETNLRNPICYEELIASGDSDFAWPALDENEACGMCYTSGTTGNPKGVVYSHRSNVLHAMMAVAPDALSCRAATRSCRWCRCSMPIPGRSPSRRRWSGAKLVMPGPKLDGQSLYELIDAEQVTMSAAVPTIWLMLLQYLEQNPQLKLPHLERVAIGGSACPEALMRAFVERYDTDVLHAWGMTEMSPLGTFGTRKGTLKHLAHEDWWRFKVKQGRPPFGVEMKITDDEGQRPAA